MQDAMPEAPAARRAGKCYAPWFQPPPPWFGRLWMPAEAVLVRAGARTPPSAKNRVASLPVVKTKRACTPKIASLPWTASRTSIALCVSPEGNCRMRARRRRCAEWIDAIVSYSVAIVPDTRGQNPNEESADRIVLRTAACMSMTCAAASNNEGKSSQAD
ncbi:hypothetical protein TRIUR3_34157 [Triticum urartu]|uniref:Uncharacterized protein n=1 Tax=Triticum urartu TaxID=4572 RepID=M7Z9Q9_TRIUA|nr:hypothetical protein TRIUR3_34157 [Triticum urartu]